MARVRLTFIYYEHCTAALSCRTVLRVFCCDQGFSVWPPDGQSVSTVLSFFLNFLVKTQQDEYIKRKKRFRFRFKRVKKKSKMHFFHIKINSMSYDL